MSYAELNRPREETHGISTSKWFVSESGTNMCLVNDSSFTLEPAGGTEAENAKFYFDTLIEAYSCSAAYYMNVGLKYPYQLEWDVERGIYGDIPDITTSESQVMEFV